MTRKESGAEARALDDVGGAHVMSWVIAIMLFLTLLTAAAGWRPGRRPVRSTGRWRVV